MTLHVHRSQRVESLVDALHARLAGAWPGDPFAGVPLVVGSRGMERWLRHELATRAGSAVRLEFLFPRGAFESAAHALLAGDAAQGTTGATALFQATRREGDAWSGTWLVHRVLTALRAHLADASFEAVRSYLRIGEGHVDARCAAPVDAREARFAAEVASVIERLHYDRPDDALAWAKEPARAPEAHRWLATLLATLESETISTDSNAATTEATAPRARLVGPSPAALLAALHAARATRRAQTRTETLHVFGLSTLRPGDQRRLRALSEHVDVHLYLLAPSAEWWVDLPTHREQLRALRERVVQEGSGKLDAAAQHALFGTNALLAANGLPSRDVQLWLEQGEYQEALRDDVASSGSLLADVQAWVNAAQDTPARAESPWNGHADCESIEVHACHGALRQCEALRDELLRRFAADRTLEPRHVLVMTPDLATYAPLLAAVFARMGTAPQQGATSARAKDTTIPEIPVHIADLGLRATNTVADVLLVALSLTEERVTATALLGLLELWPVRARFGLEEADLPELRELVRESGIRWAWDADDRRHHTQPHRDQNTVRFGLERLALGTLMPDDDEDGLGVITVGATENARGAVQNTVSENTTLNGTLNGMLNGALNGTLNGTGPASSDPARLGPAAPLVLATRERIAQFGGLAALCATLEAQRASLATPASGPEWAERLIRCMDALTKVEDASAFLRAQVIDVLAERLPPATPDTDADHALRLDRGAVEALIGDAFEMPAKGDRPVTGAVTVCAMEPMRSVPFRIIAMIGLDGGEFPRRSQPAAWDPFAAPRVGEHDRGALDRHLFLESLLCAREAFLLFGTGFEPKRGAEEPLSVVTAELEELLLRGVGRTVESAAHTSWPRRRHPLQPWSEKAFRTEGPGAAPPRLPFDPVWFEARRALAGGAATRDPAAHVGARWPAESDPPTQLSADDLARALVNAPQSLLKGRLGLAATYTEEAPSDREPLDVAWLDAWALRDQLLDALLAAGASGEAGDDAVIERVTARLRAEGTLPLDAGGQAVVDETREQVRAVRAKAEGTLGGPLTAHVEVDGLTLTATAPHTLGTAPHAALVWFCASDDPGDVRDLRAWISLLVMRAKEQGIDTAAIHARKKSTSLGDAGDAAHARERLGELLAIWRETRTSEVPLFPNVSRKLAEEDDGQTALADLLNECRSEWDGAPKQRGARDDAWVSTLYGDCDVEELESFGAGLLAKAHAVWDGVRAGAAVHQARSPGKPKKARGEDA